jgi:arylsulfatase A-like enzyme
VHDYTLDYASGFFDAHAQQGKFLAAMFSEAHEGSLEVVSAMDDSLAAFLQRMVDRGHLQNTVLFLVSDHGSHMGPYFEFFASGRQERTFPLVNVVVPDSFLARYPGLDAVLAHNQQALTTPFDLYATLRHLAVYPQPQPPGLTGTSLLTRLEYNRTCEAAGVPRANGNCPCLNATEAVL